MNKNWINRFSSFLEIEFQIVLKIATDNSKMKFEFSEYQFTRVRVSTSTQDEVKCFKALYFHENLWNYSTKNKIDQQLIKKSTFLL